MLNPRQLKKTVLFIFLLFSLLMLAARPYEAHLPEQSIISPEQAMAIAVTDWLETAAAYSLPYTTIVNGEDLSITGAAIATDTIKSRLSRHPWKSGGTVNLKNYISTIATRGLNNPAKEKIVVESVQSIVTGPALDTTAYPVTIAAEIGKNDFRISDMGPDGDFFYNAYEPAVVYNQIAKEYLVVWQGYEKQEAIAVNEAEIFVQRLNALTGDEVGRNDIRISDMGEDGDTRFNAAFPSVTFNSKANEYLVVWLGDDDRGLLVDGELEIFGQRLNATGDEIGKNDFRISNMGPDGKPEYAALFPAVTYNSVANEYLVVWSGNGTSLPNESEIYGQRLNATGDEIGKNDFRISDMGPDGLIDYFGDNPVLAYNSINNEYLIVWWGSDNIGSLVPYELEIFGQLLNAAGDEIEANDFRISDMGPDKNTAYGGVYPAVTHNSLNNQFMVVWQGIDDTGNLVVEESEIFGQRLNATGDEIGANDFRISDMGPNSDTNYGAYYPKVVYNSKFNEFLVAWIGEDNNGQLVKGEDEVFGQWLDASGSEVYDNDFRISDMGPDGDERYDAFFTAVTYSEANDEYLVVWDGIELLQTIETEIFGQRLKPRLGSNPPAEDKAIFLPVIIK